MRNHNEERKSKKNFGISPKVVIKRRSLQDFSLKKGCELSEPRPMFEQIYIASTGNPCDGCAFVPTCKLLKRFQEEDRISAVNGIRESLGAKPIEPLLTNAELALKFNISKREASKLRIPGTNTIKENK